MRSDQATINEAFVSALEALINVFNKADGVKDWLVDIAHDVVLSTAGLVDFGKKEEGPQA